VAERGGVPDTRAFDLQDGQPGRRGGVRPWDE
jgi:hypothetical protein